MKYSKLQLYIALVILVSFSVSLRSFIQIYFQVQKMGVDNILFPILYAAKLDLNLEENRQLEIENTIENFPEIAVADINLPILPWSGPREYEEDWNQLWKTHMTPILYATSEIQLNPIESAPRLASDIEQVTGVVQVVWDQKRLHDYEIGIEQWKKEQTFFSILFFFFMAVIVGVLISDYPVRLRRDFVVRTGFGGAGSLVNPEKIWGQLILIHVVATVFLYCLLFSLGYLFFPFPVLDTGKTSFLGSLIEGIFITGTLSAAICLIGWWLKTAEVDAVTAIRPSSGGWVNE